MITSIRALELAYALDLHPLRKSLASLAVQLEHEPEGNRVGEDDQNDAEQGGVGCAHDGGRNLPGLPKAADRQSLGTMAKLCPGKAKHQDCPEQGPQTGKKEQKSRWKEMSHHVISFSWNRGGDRYWCHNIQSASSPPSTSQPLDDPQKTLSWGELTDEVIHDFLQNFICGPSLETGLTLQSGLPAFCLKSTTALRSPRNLLR
jgi:hypothetical protein